MFLKIKHFKKYIKLKKNEIFDMLHKVTVKFFLRSKTKFEIKNKVLNLDIFW